MFIPKRDYGGDEMKIGKLWKAAAVPMILVFLCGTAFAAPGPGGLGGPRGHFDPGPRMSGYPCGRFDQGPDLARGRPGPDGGRFSHGPGMPPGCPGQSRPRYDPGPRGGCGPGPGWGRPEPPRRYHGGHGRRDDGSGIAIAVLGAVLLGGIISSASNNSSY